MAASRRGVDSEELRRVLLALQAKQNAQEAEGAAAVPTGQGAPAVPASKNALKRNERVNPPEYVPKKYANVINDPNRDILDLVRLVGAKREEAAATVAVPPDVDVPESTKSPPMEAGPVVVMVIAGPEFTDAGAAKVLMGTVLARTVRALPSFVVVCDERGLTSCFFWVLCRRLKLAVRWVPRTHTGVEQPYLDLLRRERPRYLLVLDHFRDFGAAADEGREAEEAKRRHKTSNKMLREFGIYRDEVMHAHGSSLSGPDARHLAPLCTLLMASRPEVKQEAAKRVDPPSKTGATDSPHKKRPRLPAGGHMPMDGGAHGKIIINPYDGLPTREEALRGTQPK